MFVAEINIMPLKELLDPAGKAVMDGLNKLNITNINDVRIGKHIKLHIEAGTKEEAEKSAQESVSKLLANPVMEYADIRIVQADNH